MHETGRVGAGLHAGSVNAVPKRLAWRAAPALPRQGIDPERVSGHSCRVGMAQDLAAAGFDVVAIMQAGRWTSAAMVAHHVERLHVTRGAVVRVPPSAGGPAAAPHDRSMIEGVGVGDSAWLPDRVARATAGRWP